MNAFGGWLGIGGGGEPSTLAPCPTDNGENNVSGGMALGTYDPNAGLEQPMGALGGDYEFINRGDWTSLAGGMHARGFGSSVAPVSE